MQANHNHLQNKRRSPGRLKQEWYIDMEQAKTSGGLVKENKNGSSYGIWVGSQLVPFPCITEPSTYILVLMNLNTYKKDTPMSQSNSLLRKQASTSASQSKVLISNFV